MGHGFEHDHGEGVFPGRVRQDVGGAVGNAHIVQGPQKEQFVAQAQRLGLGLELRLLGAATDQNQKNPFTL